MYELENFDFNDHIDLIVETVDKIEPNEVTVLVGPNGYGKSLLRKILKQNERLDKIASTSMERRTVPNHDFRALATLAIDDPETATSNASFKLVEALVKSSGIRYYVLDEPEIGMGKEAVLGLANWINTKVEELKQKNEWRGLLLISHSDFLIGNVKHDKFIDLGGHETFEEWKNREIKPIDPDALRKWCIEMWKAVKKRTQEGKGK